MEQVEEQRLDLLHGVAAIADFLGLSRRQAQHWVDTTDLPSFKVGGSVCARRRDLEAWIDAKVRR